MEKAKPAFDLVVINPFLVMGPALTKALNPSNQVFADMINGNYPGILNLVWGFVDVRDAAKAHILAMETPAAHGRYICAGESASMREVVELRRENGSANTKLHKIGLDCSVRDYVMKLGAYMKQKVVAAYRCM